MEHRIANDLDTSHFPDSGKAFYSPGASGHMMGWGAAAPDDGTAGYAPGALFIDTTGAAVYINEGSATSSDFDAITTA